MTREDLTSNTALTAVAATAGALFVVRTIKRQFFSPTIRCKLQCKCGKIQGEIRAKKEDSARIYCYCQDCRDYANFIAKLGDKQDEIIGKPHGESRLVQVCKSAVTIHKGQEHLKLAIKKSTRSNQFYMHRFYAGCCHVPLMNTFSFLGFVGVFTDFLDGNIERFAGPCRLHPGEALGQPDPPLPNAFVPEFLWKVIRYLPWRNSGPFNYDLPPVYWGEQDSNGKKQD